MDYEEITLDTSLLPEISFKNVHIVLGGDLFDFKYSSKTLTILVNAWDSISYIGNGGIMDPTIDGFLVAGKGPGNAVPNSSYLHNVFLNPTLLKPSKWTFV